MTTAPPPAKLALEDGTIYTGYAFGAEGEVTGRMVYVVTIPRPIPFIEALAPLEPQGKWPAMPG